MARLPTRKEEITLIKKQPVAKKPAVGNSATKKQGYSQIHLRNKTPSSAVKASASKKV
jgi:hypothetical protein